MNRKRIVPLLILAAVLFASLACRALNTGPSLTGTWQGDYNGQQVTITFGSGDRLTMQVDSDSINGTYKADYSKSPIEIDIFTEGTEPILTIIEFIDSDTLRMQNTQPGDPRPTVFDDALILNRVK
jgi:uncharacterized protein (TIGR03067 family)